MGTQDHISLYGISCKYGISDQHPQRYIYILIYIDIETNIYIYIYTQNDLDSFIPKFLIRLCLVTLFWTNSI